MKLILIIPAAFLVGSLYLWLSGDIAGSLTLLPSAFIMGLTQGSYKTILCKDTVNKPCPVCGTIIKKEAHVGGSIYYCEKCQRL